jgi:HK97 gp10 family phage protein
MAGIQVLGDRELLRKLNRLGVRGARRASLKSLRKGAAVLRRAAKAEAPVSIKETKGNLRKSVSFRRIRGAGGEVAAVTVRARAPHSHLVQLGTRERIQTKTGRRTGRMPGDDFMVRALRKTRGQVVATIGSSMGPLIIKEAKRL